MAADQRTAHRTDRTTDADPAAADGRATSRREREPRPPRPTNEPPPQAVMGLLNYITATSLDEDYAHVSKRRGTGDKPRRTSPGTVGLLVLALFGALVATAAVQTSRNADVSASSRESLVRQVNARKAQVTAQRATIAGLTRQVNALQDNNLAATTQGRAVQARLRRLGVLTGSVPAKGPGIRVVVDDAPGATEDNQQVLDQDLQKLVNALWLVGAEAISINGHRVTNLTAIRQAGSAITVNFISLRRPYTISAIGNENQMGAKLLDTEGGKTWLTLRASFGLQFDVNSEDSMTLPASTFHLRYARQPERLR